MPVAAAMDIRLFSQPGTVVSIPSEGLSGCYLPSRVRLVLQLAEPAPYVDSQDHQDECHKNDQAVTHHFLRLLRGP
jgi:hypothetical protein